LSPEETQQGNAARIEKKGASREQSPP